jgi:four helix bundle protein
MKSCRDLEIYTLSYDLAVRVHALTLKLPKHELYEEGSQVRRLSKGIASCIVGGYGRKKYRAEFIKFLVYAHASCDETIVHLNFIKDTNSLQDDDIGVLVSEYEGLGRKINRFIQYADKEWK